MHFNFWQVPPEIGGRVGKTPTPSNNTKKNFIQAYGAIWSTCENCIYYILKIELKKKLTCKKDIVFYLLQLKMSLRSSIYINEK